LKAGGKGAVSFIADGGDTLTRNRKYPSVILFEIVLAAQTVNGGRCHRASV
jgi:hypothetical protein